MSEDLLRLTELKELRGAWKNMQRRIETEDQDWWDSLNVDERSRAFRQLMKLMYKAEIKDKGTYRHAVYDVFEVDYCDGLEHYMEMHNCICKEQENE